MTEQLTAREALERTIELWSALAKSGSQCKAEAFQWLWPGQCALNDCWACALASASASAMDAETCGFCPIVQWRERTCMEDGAAYSNWLDAATSDELKAAAAEIVRLARESLNRLEDENETF